jgi:hypothetical protein
MLLNDGMEVLKLNSDKIWQTRRYPTVSQEVSWLSSNDVADGAGEVEQPPLPLNNNKLPPSITSTSVEDCKSKTYSFESRNVEIEGDNDLWEV